MITLELLKTTWYFLMEAFLVICAIFLVLFALYGLEWDEYKNNYAPIKLATYERRKQIAKEEYERKLAEIEKEYEERGKFSPDYHKI